MVRRTVRGGGELDGRRRGGVRIEELRSYGVKELSQMLGCRENDNPCQLTRHTTPLSPWRGVGGEAGCSWG